MSRPYHIKKVLREMITNPCLDNRDIIQNAFVDFYSIIDGLSREIQEEPICIKISEKGVDYTPFRRYIENLKQDMLKKIGEGEPCRISDMYSLADLLSEEKKLPLVVKIVFRELKDQYIRNHGI